MAEAVRKKELELAEAGKKRDAELAEARRLQEERDLEIKKLKNLPTDGEEGDREGFSLGAFRYIKRNKDLAVIVNIANASLYSIRSQCSVFNIDQRRLIDQSAQIGLPLDTGSDGDDETPFNSLTLQRDSDGNVMIDFSGSAKEEEIIRWKDLYGEALYDMGLKKYIDIPEEQAKLDDCLKQIGALRVDSESQFSEKFIRLEVLIAAMRIHNYEYSGLNLSTKLRGADFRKLNPKSMRIMNRLTRVVAQYQDKYQ